MARTVVTRTGRVTRINDDGTRVLCRAGWGKPWVGPTRRQAAQAAQAAAASGRERASLMSSRPAAHSAAVQPSGRGATSSSSLAATAPAVVGQGHRALAHGAATLRAAGLLESDDPYGIGYGPGEAYDGNMLPELQGNWNSRGGRVAGFHGGERIA